MPLLLSLLACEKIIFENVTNKASLVNILHDVYIPVIRGVQIPENTLAPLNWVVFSMWYRQPTDGDSWWEQLATLTGENGETLLQSQPMRFQMDHQIMRATVTFTNIPVYKESQCMVKLYIRNLGIYPDLSASTVQYEEIMSYPIALHHTFFPS